MIAYQVTSVFIILPWQTVGLLRSADFHYRHFGQPILLYCVQATVLICLIAIASHFVGLFQTLSFNQSFKSLKSKLEPPQYSIQVTDNGKQLVLTGLLDLGITAAVELILKQHDGINQIKLESKGGQIYEGRGLALLFHRLGLDTYSSSYCLSACATAYIGGENRFLGDAALLGFHQYTFDSKRLQPFQQFYDLDEEQKKDLAIYRSKGIDANFIDRIFHKPNSEIWYPSQKTLLKAGVVTKIVY